jgi:hypothetical protein
MSKHKILHQPATNRWMVVIEKTQVDITETLDAILRPASNRILSQDARIGELEKALRGMLGMFDDGHCMTRFDWGKSFLRAEDIRELNEVPIEARRVLKEQK